MTKDLFIESIALYAQKYAPQFGIKVVSPIIAQACLESAYGTSAKAKHHNYFGLKYRKGRVDCNNGYFYDGGSEQNQDGTYTNLPTSTSWYSFDSMEDGVLGYFQFTNITTYANLKGVTDPKEYLQKIKADGYATSLNYVENVYAVIEKFNLTKFDDFERKESEDMAIDIVANTGFKGCNVSNRIAGIIEYIVTHYTGAEGTAANNVAYFNSGNRSASADFFIDQTGVIYQYNPDIKKYYTWHCGGGRQTSQGGEFYQKCTNSNSIGIEMCCNKSGNKFTFTDATVASTIKLVKYLMKLYSIPADRVIRHYDCTGKYCPNVYGWIPPTGSTAAWDAFKTAIAGETTDTTTNVTSTTTDTTTASSGNDLVRAGQQHSINFTGVNISVDGFAGSETAKQKVRVLQTALNLDYRANLTVDGEFGSKTKKALGSHYVTLGEKQYMVTACEILLMLNGYNPNGVESPGSFGNGCKTAVMAYQKANGLTASGRCDAATFIKMIS